MDIKVKRIGVLTGGGDCPGLNAVIRAVVKTAICQYGIEVYGIEDGFKGLIQKLGRPLTTKDVSGILPRGGTILGTTNRDNPFRYPVMVNGQKEFQDVSDQVIANMKELEIDALVIIGGDGSLNIGRELHQKGLPVVGVPKTIDNDLSATDVTFGFDTAITTATEAIDKLHTTAESHHRVMVLEVMGRYAGWIAIEAGIAGGADIILIPEIPYRIEKICAKVKQRVSEGKKFSIVVAAEGATPIGGEMVIQKMIEDSTDPIRLGGIGNVLAKQVESCSGMESRAMVLGHLQRGGSPTPFDRILATRLGAGAVELVMSGGFGRMVCLRTPNIESVPLEDAVGELKKVNPESDLVRAALDIGISFGD